MDLKQYFKILDSVSEVWELWINKKLFPKLGRLSHFLTSASQANSNMIKEGKK